jgi:hypothetical protein
MTDKNCQARPAPVFTDTVDEVLEITVQAVPAPSTPGPQRADRAPNAILSAEVDELIEFTEQAVSSPANLNGAPGVKPASQTDPAP